ncbi:MAG: membrane-bound lytic murein transglycosylase MltF [Gammaproteobacteria bacterium]|nr:membrane-bound lytic murein transglycosylase MltF [Gammaproteobacteria bacterium]
MKRARPPTDFVLRWAPWVLLSGAVLLTLSTCSPRAPILQRVKALGVLRVATLNSPTTYYVGPTGPTGFEYDLARGMADDLGLKLEVLVLGTAAEVIDAVRSGRAHLGASGLALTSSREKLVRFSPPIRKVVPQLVYRAGMPKPKDLSEVTGRLTVVAGDHTAELLALHKQQFSGLAWQETGEVEAEELLFQVANEQLDYTVANSDLVAINQRYYPQLRVAFALAQSQDLAWAFALGDDSLYDAAVSYLRRLGSKELVRLRDRHFGHVARVNYSGALTLAGHVQTRLPRYRRTFEAAAAQFGLDWRLLAAVGYQESNWDPEAVSPTGVRGLMQITTETAAFLEIENRLDPIQSIYGGARYLQQLKERLPPEIKEPDRTWMTLAAYNMGLGHLLDARALAGLHDGDPTRWVDVRGVLPLLTQSKWFSKTRHGYARGHEAVAYVDNIRTYFDMLTWMTEARGASADDAPPPPPEPEPAKKGQEEPLNIKSPLL